jgi:hypothetical protein
MRLACQDTPRQAAWEWPFARARPNLLPRPTASRCGSLRPCEVFVPTTVGGYWLYHHGAGPAASAPGARATLGPGLPVGARVNILLKGGALELLRRELHEADLCHLGIGVALNETRTQTTLSR